MPEIRLARLRIVNEYGADMGVEAQRYSGIADFADLLEDFVIGASSNVVVRGSAVLQVASPDLSFPNFYDMDLFLRIALLRSVTPWQLRANSCHIAGIPARSRGNWPICG